MIHKQRQMAICCTGKKQLADCRQGVPFAERLAIGMGRKICYHFL